MLRVLRAVLEDPAIEKVGHDLKFDTVVLARHGVRLEGLGLDTMLASYLLDATRSNHPLEGTTLEHLGYKALTEEDVCGRGAKAIGFEATSPDAALNYAGERADLALQLADRLAPMLVTDGLDQVYRDLERPLIPVLAAMERAGVRIDGVALAGQSHDIERTMTRLTAQIFEIAGESFNINSPQQLSKILFDKLQLPALKRNVKTRTASTSVDVLEELALVHDLPRLILEWRALQKLKGTYIDALPELVNPETGRVHTCFNQAVAATGRLSSSDPNLQNIPIRTELGREIRRAFTADPGHVLISADYSQIELRVLAHLAGDETLREAFQAGTDIHDQTALKVFGPESGLDPHELRRTGEDHQLRPPLREDRVHPRQGYRRDAAGRSALHRRVLRGLSPRAELHRAHARGGARHRRGEDLVRAKAARAGAHEPQRSDPGGRRTSRREHADSGHGRGHHEAGDDSRTRRARRITGCADDPDRA